MLLNPNVVDSLTKNTVKHHGDAAAELQHSEMAPHHLQSSVLSSCFK